MVFMWLIAGLLILLSGLGVLQSAVALQSYILLLLGVFMASSGTVLMVRKGPLGAESD